MEAEITGTLQARGRQRSWARCTLTGLSKILGLLLLAAGGLGFVGAAVIAGKDDPRLDALRLPLGHPEGIAVDANGRIYVGSRAYWRISRFHPDGAFDRSWRVPMGRGAWRFRIADGDTLVAAIGSGKLTSYYLIEGSTLRAAESAPGAAFQADAATYAAHDGTIYQINPLLLSVEKTTPGGGRVSVIRPEPLLLLMSAPIHAWSAAVCGMLLLVCASKLARSERHR